MAKNYSEILALVNAGNQMGLSNTIKRDYGIPLDFTSVQESLEAAVIYAATSTKAYVGQPLSVGGKLYIIDSVAAEEKFVAADATEYDNFLKEVGSATEGDNASISLENGVLSIYGFKAAANATLPQKQADGTIKWVGIDAIVEGDGNTKSVVEAADGSAITVTPSYDEESDTHTYTLDVTFPAIPEYAIAVDERAEGDTTTTYHLTKDGQNVDVAIVVPDAYDDTALAGRVEALEAIDNVDDVIYDSDAKKIYLVSGDKQIGEGFDASDFVKDGMIDSVALTDNKLVITWNTDGGKTSATEIPLDSFIDVYTAGNGINVNGNEISIDTEVVATVSALNDVKATAEAAQTAEQVSSAINTALEPYAKVADVERDYAKKATTLAGYGITDAYTTEQVDTMIQNINQGNQESASAVNTKLENYKTSNDQRVDVIETKLGTIEENAEVNVIETVKVNGTALEVAADRSVNVVITPETLDVYTKAEVDSKVTTINAAIETAQARADKGVEDAATAKARADEAYTLADSNKTNIATLTGTVEGHTETINDHSTRIAAAETAINGHIGTLETLSEQVAKKAAQADLATLSETVGTNTGNITALTSRVAANETAISTKANASEVYTKTEVNAITGTPVEGKTLVQMIADAQTAATYDDAELRAAISANATAITTLTGDAETEGSVAKAKADAIAAVTALQNGAVKDNADAIAKLNGDDKVEGSIDYKVAQEVAKILNDNDASDIDTLEEIAAWIKNDTAGVASMNAAIAKNTSDIAAINDTTIPALRTEVKKYTDDSIAALNLAETYEAKGEAAKVQAALEAHAAENTTKLSAIDAAIETLNGDVETEGSVQKIVADAIASMPAIPVATTEVAGIVKASDEITVAEDGTMEICTMSTDKLVQGANTLVLNGGKASE